MTYDLSDKTSMVFHIERIEKENAQFKASLAKAERKLKSRWEKRRFEAACAAMSEMMRLNVAREEHPTENRAYTPAETRAAVAVAHADALLKSLDSAPEVPSGVAVEALKRIVACDGWNPASGQAGLVNVLHETARQALRTLGVSDV